jgi:hypothetical protein
MQSLTVTNASKLNESHQMNNSATISQKYYKTFEKDEFRRFGKEIDKNKQIHNFL